jgi:hypothetical protein
MLSKAQRVAFYNLCTILNLTTHDPALRATTLDLRELIRKNTLDMKHNACSFDEEEQRPVRSPSQKHAKA